MNIFGLFEINKIKKVREVHCTPTYKLYYNYRLVGNGWGFNESITFLNELNDKVPALSHILAVDGDTITNQPKVFEILQFLYKDHCEFKLIDKG